MWNEVGAYLINPYSILPLNKEDFPQDLKVHMVEIWHFFCLIFPTFWSLQNFNTGISHRLKEKDKEKHFNSVPKYNEVSLTYSPSVWIKSQNLIFSIFKQFWASLSWNIIAPTGKKKCLWARYRNRYWYLGCFIWWRKLEKMHLRYMAGETSYSIWKIIWRYILVPGSSFSCSCPVSNYF